MKYLVLSIPLLLFGTHDLVAQLDHTPRDIEDVHVHELMCEQDSTQECRFRNFALRLFLVGTSVNDSVLAHSGRNYVGVCAQKDDHGAVALNLLSVAYKDTREKDFHKRIHFPGFEGVASFFLICNNDEERRMFHEALRSYLRKNAIPFNNMAFRFMLEHDPEDDLFGRLYDSDGRSKVVVGPETYSYLRRNGNFLIQIQGVPDRGLDDDVKKLYVTDHFIEHWYTIGVFLINEDQGTSYNTKFK